jgi:hypothetical protein
MKTRRQDSDLRPNGCQKPLPDSADHNGTLLLARSDTSHQHVLVPDVGGRLPGPSHGPALTTQSAMSQMLRPQAARCRSGLAAGRSCRAGWC